MAGGECAITVSGCGAGGNGSWGINQCFPSAAGHGRAGDRTMLSLNNLAVLPPHFVTVSHAEHAPRATPDAPIDRPDDHPFLPLAAHVRMVGSCLACCPDLGAQALESFLEYERSSVVFNGRVVTVQTSANGKTHDSDARGHQGVCPFYDSIRPA
jgi:hypothetical protein